MPKEKDSQFEAPADYPSEHRPASLAGAGLKISLVYEEGKYYEAGNSPRERWLAWRYSESLVERFIEKCRETKKGPRAELSEAEIISQYVNRAIAHGGYGTPAQVRWAFRKVALRLGWPIPENCSSTLD